MVQCQAVHQSPPDAPADAPNAATPRNWRRRAATRRQIIRVDTRIIVVGETPSKPLVGGSNPLGRARIVVVLRGCKMKPLSGRCIRAVMHA